MQNKYPKTLFLPFSPGATNTDKVIKSLDKFINQDIIISEKIDGSNVCMDRFGCYARSAKTPTHPSFDAFKAFHATVKNYLWPNHEYFGEWAYAQHSIAYKALPGYFLLFGIRSRALEPGLSYYWTSWDYLEQHLNAINMPTEFHYPDGKVLKNLDIPTVPVLFRGTVRSAKELESLVLSLHKGASQCGAAEKEGVVVRVASEFTNFNDSIGKFVRKDHIQTKDHWKHMKVVKNETK